jgi:hypothetical protein
MEKKKGLVRGMVLGLKAINAHVPVLNDLLHALEVDTRGTKVYRDKEMIARERREDFTFENVGQLEHPLCATEIAEHIGVPLEDLNDFRKTARAVKVFDLWGGQHSFIIQKFLDWDL